MGGRIVQVWAGRRPPLAEYSPLGRAEKFRIAEECFNPLGNDVRDKVMYKNAKKFYKRGQLK